MQKSVRQGRGSAIMQSLPHFYQSGDYENLLYGFVDIFGRMLDGAEEDLLRAMRAHWVNTADNEGSQGFDTVQKGDLDKIFAFFLESLGGTTQLRQIERREGDKGLADDTVYRERVKGLIGALLNGANTVAGIRDIVAANLGIYGNDDAALKAKQSIQVIEFLTGNVESDISALKPIALFEKFTADNSANPVAVSLRLRLQVTDPDNLLAAKGWKLKNITIWDTRLDQCWARFDGPLKKGDQLEFLPEGAIQLNTVMVKKTDRLVPLPEGRKVNFRIGADFEDANGVLQAGRILSSANESKAGLTEANFDYTVFYLNDQIFNYSLALTQLQPATFEVRIPWDIPGFTDKLDAHPGDNTRGLIHYIVDKVKAAGVYSEINFVKSLGEEHEMNEQLNFGLGRVEDQQMAEGDFSAGNFKKPYGSGLQHEMNEHFGMNEHSAISGIFDFTYFESLNTFA